jgi:chemotaxis protein methyltransferase CheR
MKFDAIFCRNVMIYFDDKTKSDVFNTLYSLLADTGYLFLGAMENTYMLTDKFESQQFENTIVYRKKKHPERYTPD